MSGAPRDLAAEAEAALAAMPYARFLGVRADLKGDELTLILPYRDDLIGNAFIPALHGGVVGAFLEITALITLRLALDSRGPAKTIDVGVDYLRSGKPADTYARARVTRLGRRIANVRVEAWQARREDPIAALHGHFLVRGEHDASSSPAA